MPPEPAMSPWLIYLLSVLAAAGLWFALWALARICASLER